MRNMEIFRKKWSLYTYQAFHGLTNPHLKYRYSLSFVKKEKGRVIEIRLEVYLCIGKEQGTLKHPTKLIVIVCKLPSFETLCLLTSAISHMESLNKQINILINTDKVKN